MNTQEDEQQRLRRTYFLRRTQQQEAPRENAVEKLEPRAERPTPPQVSSDCAAMRGINQARLKMIRVMLGETITNALDDPDVIEVVLNGHDGRVWSETLDGSWKTLGYMSYASGMQLINAVAGCYNRVVTVEKPIFDCQLPYHGERFGATIPPVALGPSFNIRKRSVRVIPLDEWVAAGALSPAGKRVIVSAVAKKDNVLIIGGTGSGKTTFANAVIGAMTETSPADRQIIIEDVAELRSTAENREEWLAFDDPERSMQKLVKQALRRRPDRIIIGEIRDHTAYDLCKAWNTGHGGGLSTIHANNCAEAFQRLEALTRENKDVGGNIDDTVREQLAAAIQLFIWIAKVEDPATGKVTRKIMEIRRVEGYDAARKSYVFGETLV